MTRDAQFGPKSLVEPKPSSIEDSYNSACEELQTKLNIAYKAALSTTDDLIACRVKLAEALAAKEQAEAKLDEAVADNRRLLDSAERWCSLHNEAEKERDTSRAAVDEWVEANTFLAGAFREKEDKLRANLKECADELEAWVEGNYRLTFYPSEKRRYDRDMDPVHRARALLAHPTTEPAKAEAEDSFVITEKLEEEEKR